jgi:hypothetical protein
MLTEAVVESLRAKHPAGPPSPLGSTAGPRNEEIPPEDTPTHDQVVQAGHGTRNLRLDPPPSCCRTVVPCPPQRDTHPHPSHSSEHSSRPAQAVFLSVHSASQTRRRVQTDSRGRADLPTLYPGRLFFAIYFDPTSQRHRHPLWLSTTPLSLALSDSAVWASFRSRHAPLSPLPLPR